MSTSPRARAIGEPAGRRGKRRAAAAMALLLAACGEPAPPAEATNAAEGVPAAEAAARPAPPLATGAPGMVVPSNPRPSADDPRIDAARRLMRSGRFDLAETALRTVIAEKPESARARFFLGVALGQQRRHAAASELFTEVLESDLDFAERRHVDHFHGWALYYLGEPERARAAFVRHLDSDPTEGDSAFALGLIALEADDLDEAERRLTQAIALQASDPRLGREVAKAEARMGDLRQRQGRLEEAIEWWRRCTSRHPDHHEAWHKLAQAYGRLDREAERIEALRQRDLALARLGRIDPPPMGGGVPATERSAPPAPPPQPEAIDAAP